MNVYSYILGLALLIKLMRGEFIETDSNARRILSLVNSSSYSKFIRPESFITINLTIFVNQINSIDDSNKLMKSSINIMGEWKDTRLSWKPTSTRVQDLPEFALIPMDKIWTPDLVILNSDSLNIFMPVDSKNLAYVDNDGNVAVLYSMASLSTRCEMDVMKFPMDKQVCPIKISSWTLCEKVLTLEVEEVVDKFYIQNGVWSLQKTVAHHKSERDRFAYQTDDGCNMYVTHIDFYLSRRPLYYMVNLIFPSFFLTLLTIACFALPAAAQFSISVTIFMSYSISSVRISSQMPVQSTNMPIVTWYFLGSMIFTLISFYWFVLDYSLRAMSYLPHWVARICVRLRSWARRARRHKVCKQKTSKFVDPIDIQETSDSSQEDKKQTIEESNCFKCQTCVKCQEKERGQVIRDLERSEFDKNMICLNRLVFMILFVIIITFNLVCWLYLSLS